MTARALPAFGLLAALALAPLPAASDTTTLTAAGSTALLPLLMASAEVYSARHPQTLITVTGGGSRAGLAAVAAGTVDLGMSDTPATGYPNLVDHHVCVVGYVVLANPGVGVAGVTKQQLRDIFAGKLTNWKQLGGADVRIVPIERPPGSGTRLVFDRNIMGPVPEVDSGAMEDVTGTLLGDVRTTPGAISYAAFVGIKSYGDAGFAAVDGVTELAIDGAKPTEEEIGAGTYPLWSFEHVYTNGPPGRDASRFLALVESNVETVHALGFIPMRVMSVDPGNR